MSIGPEYPEQLFLDQLHLIEKVIESVCRRHCCFGPDAEDFGSTVKLKLMDDDYAVLRKYRAQSSLAAYLMVVIANLYRDFRIGQWGKWRPSAAARKLGAMAVRLEQLRSRDGYSLDEAVELMRTHFGDEAPPREELERLDAQLPVRLQRRFEGEERLGNLPDERRADERVVAGERSKTYGRARAALAKALAGLAPEDRLILKMRFEDGFKVVTVARQLGIRQRRLYSRIEKLLKTLRKSLEEEGIDGDVTDLFDSE